MVFQAILSGLVMGAIYALMGQGLYITYSTTKTFNFAHGDFVMVGGYLWLTLAFLAALWGPLAILGVILVLAVMGIAVYRIAIRPLPQVAHSYLLSTAAVGFMVINSTMLIWGKSGRSVPSIFGDDIIFIFGAGIMSQEIVVIIGSLVIMGLLLIFYQKSLFGKAIRATAYNSDAAELMGINTKGVATFAYILASILGGIAGIFIGPIMLLNAYMGLPLILKAFSAAVIGGLTNPLGILLGGIALGICESVLGIWISAWKDAIVFTFIIIFIGVRPTGLFGVKAIQKV